MRKLILIISMLSIMILICSVAFAGWVKGYRRSNGTYVQGHYRSSPDGVKWNNYGPSQSNSDHYNPYGRDYDGDGIANMYDLDDDNDGIADDYDRAQYNPNCY